MVDATAQIVRQSCYLLEAGGQRDDAADASQKWQTKRTALFPCFKYKSACRGMIAASIVPDMTVSCNARSEIGLMAIAILGNSI